MTTLLENIEVFLEGETCDAKTQVAKLESVISEVAIGCSLEHIWNLEGTLVVEITYRVEFETIGFTDEQWCSEFAESVVSRLILHGWRVENVERRIGSKSIDTRKF